MLEWSRRRERHLKSQSSCLFYPLTKLNILCSLYQLVSAQWTGESGSSELCLGGKNTNKAWRCMCSEHTESTVLQLYRLWACRVLVLPFLAARPWSDYLLQFPLPWRALMRIIKDYARKRCLVLAHTNC